VERRNEEAAPGARRAFLRGAAAGVGAMLLPQAAGAASELPVQPAAFEVMPDSALLWVSAQAGSELAIEIGTDEALGSPRRIPVSGLVRDNDFTAGVPLEGLAPDRVWFYRVIDVKTGAPVSRAGRFRTAPVSPRPFTFAWSADMDEAYRPFRLFDAIGARDPEFFLHLGDTIYADLPRNQFNPSVTHYRRKHAANRRDSHLQQFLLRHPTFAIWDDHETDNDCHGGHPHMAEGRQVFREYWPCRTAAPEGLYRRFGCAGVDFLVLDTRSFRSPHAEADGPGKSMLGVVQKQWLLDALGSSTAPFKFVITSVPFQGGGADTWGNYRTERTEIATFIRERKLGGVVFLTGDYHLARDWSNPKAGFREFMAGPIGSFVHYRRTPASRERYEKAGTFHYGDGTNFGFVQVDPAARTARVSFVDGDGKTMHTVECTA
jgi:alkaline phosphatase D